MSTENGFDEVIFNKTGSYCELRRFPGCVLVLENFLFQLETRKLKKIYHELHLQVTEAHQRAICNGYGMDILTLKLESAFF